MGNKVEGGRGDTDEDIRALNPFLGNSKEIGCLKLVSKERAKKHNIKKDGGEKKK